MFKTLSYFIFWNFLNFKASGKSFMILRHKSTVSISSILSWTTLGKSTWLTLVMFDIATMKTVYQMQPCITNDTNLKKVFQLLFLFFFFFFKIKFFLLKVVLSLQEMALQKKRKLINRSLPMQCTFNTAGFKISQEIIDNLRSMIILQIQESWTWIDGNRIKRSIQITSRPQIQNFSTIRNIKPSSIAIWHIYGPIPIHNTTLAAAATKRSFVLTKCGKTGEHCIRYFQSRDCCCRICSRVRS